MAENIDNPCEELEPPPRPQPGEEVPPDPPMVKFDEPVFPSVEQNFPDRPISRVCTMVPRNLYYSDSIQVNRAQQPWRDGRDAAKSFYTNNNPAPSKYYDSFRFVVGKVFSENGRHNHIFNNSLVPDLSSTGLDFRVIVDPTVPAWEDNTILTKNRVRCLFDLNAVAKRFGQRDDEKIRDWMKSSIRTQGPGVVLTDTAFNAPASFFAKEADGLNIRLPELTSMQVFISDHLTPLEQEMLARGPDGTRESELMKKSLYEKFAMEYMERPEYCESGTPGVQTHKFPANKLSMINDITLLATNSENNTDSEYSSFRRVFRRNYDFYTKISFDIKQDSPIAAKAKELNMDPLILGMLDVESPSNETIYTQILDEKISDFVGISANDGTSLNHRPYTYESFLEKFEKYIDPVNHPSFYRKLKLILDPASFPLSFLAIENWMQEQRLREQDPDLLGLWSTQQNVLTFLFKNWMKAHLANKKRDFKKIMNDELSYSEVIAYRLEKRDAQTNDIIQNFYFFNDPDTDRVDFIDTQVNFGKRYTYSLYTVNMVLGSNYVYRHILDRSGYPTIAHDVGGGFGIEFEVYQNDNVSFVEAPYFQQELLIVDAPPLPPDVWFLPVETLTTDLVWLWFTPRLGQLLEKPIAILEEDLEIIENMKMSQNVGVYRDAEVRYKSDSDPTHYQLLVLDDPPARYQDFILGRKYETTINSPSFKKSVEPNRDYYITFRARDYAGISNPTKVYRYRLNSFGDGVDHEIEEYEFAEQAQEYLLSFNQQVSVAPAAPQRAINFNKASEYSDNLGDTKSLLETTRGTTNLHLGVDEESNLWNKKFLIEIISSVTGKKIQIMTTWSQLSLNHGELLPNMVKARSGAIGLGSIPGLRAQTGCFTEEHRAQRTRNEASSSEVIKTSLGVRLPDQVPTGVNYNNESD
tara:strand:- start:1743 stop:4505 length:2763 start_codon:yes stop_codon:yes gene_type:complete